jgi:Tfp pilus assembly protein PilO
MTTPRLGLSIQARVALFLCLALLLLNGIGFFFYTLPRSLESRSRSARLAALREEVQSLRDQLQVRRASVQTRAANIRDEARFLGEVAAARDPEMLATINEIRRIAQQSGVTVPTWKFDQKAVEAAPIDAFEMTMPVEGDYNSLVAFLEALRRSEHFVSVDELRLAGGDGAPAKLEMKVSAFFRAQVAS